jgi:hypothetical protein
MVDIANDKVGMCDLYLLFHLVSNLGHHRFLTVLSINDPLIVITMVVRAFKVTITLFVVAWLCFVVERMVLRLLPTMTLETSCLKNATFIILTDERTSLPILT